MKRLTILLAAAVAMTACGPEDPPVVNQCLRVELFKQCMTALPAGPVATKYNDWAEVVSECESAARMQSYRAASTIPKECKL